MKKTLLYFGVLLSNLWGTAQENYQFTDLINIDSTPVISQGNTGTCWSFSTSSFIESEIIRLTGEYVNISEMYNVRNTYPVKASNYVYRQGKAQFSEGGLAHDVLNSIRDYGLVPAEVYSGLLGGKTKHNHSEMASILSSMLDTYIKNPGRTLDPKWKEAFNSILDVYLGENITEFYYHNKKYTPQQFAEAYSIQPEDYINITSFSHEPFYGEFILNIPDNFSNGSYFNLPIEELVHTIDHALKEGFTIGIDCDVSEKTFSSKNGIAVVPEKESNNLEALYSIYPEKEITQEYRQQEFENYNTTDDHLMHITGKVEDQKGNNYYKVKNSWGSDEKTTKYGGYVYFSDAYIRLKTISITLHKDGVPRNILKKLNQHKTVEN